jgi:hypothetical protein
VEGGEPHLFVLQGPRAPEVRFIMTEPRLGIRITIIAWKINFRPVEGISQVFTVAARWLRRAWCRAINALGAAVGPVALTATSGSGLSCCGCVRCVGALGAVQALCMMRQVSALEVQAVADHRQLRRDRAEGVGEVDLVIRIDGARWPIVRCGHGHWCTGAGI